MTATYDCIATTTAAGGETSISFTSISGTFTDLVLVSNLLATTAYELFVQFNSDTGSNYSTTYLQGDGSSASSGRESNKSQIIAAYSASANPTAVITHIQNYSNSTTYKTVLSRSSAASSAVIAYVGLWRSTAAITSIQLKLTATKTFSAGATFTLYGIKSEV